MKLALPAGAFRHAMKSEFPMVALTAVLGVLAGATVYLRWQVVPL
jgi:hypothetical protein